MSLVLENIDFLVPTVRETHQRLSILSDPKQIGNISLDVCKKLLRHVRAQSSVRGFPGACSLGRGPGAAEEEEAEEAAEEEAQEGA